MQCESLEVSKPPNRCTDYRISVYLSRWKRNREGKRGSIYCKVEAIRAKEGLNWPQ